MNLFSIYFIFCLSYNLCKSENNINTDTNFTLKIIFDQFFDTNKNDNLSLLKDKSLMTVSTLPIMEDAKLLGPDIIIKYGYPSEIHHVITEDGYIIELHRITHSKGKPILLMHGILDTSATWILMGPNNGLGYILYDLGYDVWMGNVRGNRYSKNHTTLGVDDRKFWDFSFHEMGVYDLPAMIDYILQNTGHKQIHYIGHSQGTAIFWVMCSERPEYAKKITSMHALAPIAFVSDMKSPFIKGMLLIFDLLSIATSFLQINQFMPYSKFLVESSQKACHDAAFTQEICSNVLFLIAGFNSKQLNKTMLPVILSHTPSGASIKQLIHFGQMARSGYFRKFNYGFYNNYKIYKQIRPPNYKLDNCIVPSYLYYSENDWLATLNDIKKLYEILPNVQDKYLIEMKEFNHLDFLWAVDVKNLLYNRLIENLKKY